MTWLDYLTYFVVLYPLYMSFAWTIGGLFFYFRWEHKPRQTPAELPFYSIVVAAHNEEGCIRPVIENLMQLHYPRYEIIAVNDGSTDNTAGILNRLARSCPWLKVIHLNPNSGKAKAVNIGVLFSKGELILVIDADCFVDRNALREMAWHFVRYPKVGAVTGNPRIRNRTSLLGKIQVGEYSSIIGLIKRSQRLLGKVLTVSGVIAAYRKTAFCDSGLFDSDTVTEDIDITWKLQKKMWDIRYEPRALCFILSPETIRGLWKQRVRWAHGGISVIRKHYDIWTKWRHRRFWPIYLEYVGGIVWSFSLGCLLLYWLVNNMFRYFGSPQMQSAGQFIFPPLWTGSVLALVCLLQFAVSLFIDYRYENKSIIQYYIWMIWYPFFYWLISAFAVYAGVYKIIRSKGKVRATWKSPDRGIHKLE